jgi:TPR repeat protein
MFTAARVVSGIGLLLLLQIPFALTTVCASAQTSALNTAAQWPNLENSRNRWDGSGWDEVRQAAAGGNADAQSMLGYMYENPDEYGSDPSAPLNAGGPTAANMPEAVRWYLRAAEERRQGAEYRLGLCYLTGRGVEKDEETGLEWVRKAADQQNPWAEDRLARCYAEGIGEPRNDHDRSLDLWERAARAGLTDAFDPLIFQYRSGFGNDVNIVAAARWYCNGWMAAYAVGHNWYPVKNMLPKPQPAGSPAPNNGSGADDPFHTSLALYLRSARLGDAGAMVRLGRMYSIGQWVPRDPTGAWQWYELAAENDSSEAVSRRSETEQRMSKEQLQNARQQLELLKSDLRMLENNLKAAYGPAQ